MEAPFSTSALRLYDSFLHEDVIHSKPPNANPVSCKSASVSHTPLETRQKIKAVKKYEGIEPKNNNRMVDGAHGEEDEEPILFSPPITQKHIFANSNLFVTCYAREGVNAVRLTWKKSSKEITEKIGRVHVEESSVTPGGVDIILDKVTLRDQGRYHCSAIVDGQEVSKFFELSVYRRVVFVDTPPIQYAPEESNHLIRCDASGHPSPNITWQRVNGTITAGKFLETPEGLVIRNVTRLDGGVYVCRGSLMTKHISDLNVTEIKVIIQYKPQWKSNQPTEMYSFIGRTVNLTCEAEGEPAPSYIWSQKSNPITPSNDTQIIFEDGKTILSFRVDADDFTDYSCTSSNDEGSIVRTITLKEGAKPGLPDVELVESDIDRIKLKIDAPSADDIPLIGYRVEYKREDQSWESCEFEDFLIDNAEFVLKDLEQDTQYVVRVRAQNEAGDGDNTLELRTKTLRMTASPVKNTISSLAVKMHLAVELVNIIILSAFILAL